MVLSAREFYLSKEPPPSAELNASCICSSAVGLVSGLYRRSDGFYFLPVSVVRLVDWVGLLGMAVRVLLSFYCK